MQLCFHIFLIPFIKTVKYRFCDIFHRLHSLSWDRSDGLCEDYGS